MNVDTVPPAKVESVSKLGPVVVAVAIGTAVSVGLGIYGRMHTPTGKALHLAGFANELAAKSAVTTVALVLVLVQLITALAIYGRVPLQGAWVVPVHRWSGRLAVAVTIPVAVQCLYALGYQTFDARVALHSLLGCFFYGAFVCKMLLLTRDDTPKWALPLLGGLVFVGLTALWLTAAGWYYLNFG